jgi:hypothetical protein
LQAEKRIVHPDGLYIQEHLHRIVCHPTPGLFYKLQAPKPALILPRATAKAVFNQFRAQPFKTFRVTMGQIRELIEYELIHHFAPCLNSGNNGSCQE